MSEFLCLTTHAWFLEASLNLVRGILSHIVVRVGLNKARSFTKFQEVRRYATYQGPSVLIIVPISILVVIA